MSSAIHVLALCLVPMFSLSAPPPEARAAPAITTPAAIQSRIVYKYSVVPGGIRTPEELTRARKNDPVVAAHFADFGVDTRVITLREDLYAYVSYRQGDKVRYTKKKQKVCKGETVITDGKNYARTRCANRLKTSLKPGKPQKTPGLSYNEPGPADLDVILPSPPLQDFGSQPLASATPASATITFGFSGASAPTLSLSGTDFSVGLPSCNGTFTSCTATVSFAPTLPGLRQDAVVAKDTSGNKQVATLLRGIGTAPRLAFSPGVIATFAGNGTWGYADSASPTTASFRNPQGVASDSAGNLYIADSVNMMIRKIDASTGSVTTVAGNGSPGKAGDGGPALKASLNTPTGIAVDAAGNLYIADQGNNLLRRVDALSGLISTIAGGAMNVSGTDGFGDGQSATSAIFQGPNNVAVNTNGDIYIADSFHNLVRKVSAATDIITVVAGGGSGGGSDGLGDGGAATAAILSDPNGITLDSAGNLYIADSNNHMVRTVNAATGIISVVAGNGAGGFSGDGGLAVSARVGTPTGVTLDAGGNLYIADFANSLIRRVNAASGLISTIAAGLSQPTDLTLSSGGNLFIADYSNNVIRNIIFSQAPLTFPSTNVGTQTPASNLVLNNVGNADLSIAGIVFSAGFSQTSSGSTDCSTSAIPSGGSCVLSVVFAPTAGGAISGSLQLTTNDLNRPATLITIPMTGTGAAGTPQANLSTTSLTFASQSIGTASTPQAVSLSNSGNSALAIYSIGLTGANPSDFSVTASCPASLAVSASCTSAVTFKPIVAGTRTATLAISDSLKTSPQIVMLTGTGAGGAQVTFNPASANFGNLVAGVKSPVLNVAVTNAGTASLNVYGMALSGLNGADFSLVSSTCGSSIGASASCSIVLAFTPAALGARTASLLITDSAGDSPQSLSLSGTGIAGPLTVTPAALSFASTLVGIASAPQAVTISNASGTSITFSGLAFGGTNAGDFLTTTNTCPQTLASGASCSVSVVLTPAAIGARAATLNLTDTASNSPQSVSLSGTGMAGPLTVTPAALSFGSIIVGVASAPQAVTVSNTSGTSITLSGMAFGGTNAADFLTTTNTCPQTLASGASCSVSVVLTPAAVGARAATLNFTDTASNSPQSVSLSGTGMAGPLTVTPAALSFASIIVGVASAPQIVTINNSSGISITFSSLGVGGTNAADFRITTNTCPQTLANGASCSVSVVLTPSAAGTRAATLNFTDNASNSPQSPSLSGTGIAGPLTVAPSALSFGSPIVGAASAPQTVTISNSSGVSITFSGLGFSGTNAADFVTTTNTCPQTLANGASCSVAVVLTPSAVGARSATLNFTDTASNSPQSVSLSGTGIAAPLLTVTPSALSFGSTIVGATSTPQTVAISNSSAVSITFSGLGLGGTNAADFRTTTNTCPQTLASGASCSVSVVLTPSAAGARSATLNFTDTASNSPQSLSLSGTGVAGSLTVTPSTLTFGSSIVGTTSAAQSVTLSVAAGLVTPNTFTLSGTNASDFAIAANTCTTAISSTASCNVSVAFQPTAVGARSATLLMTNSAANSPQSVSLSGTAALLTISVAPASLSFASVSVGAKSTTQSVTLTNTSPTSITLNGITLSGTNSGDFSIASNACGATLAAASNCTVSLVFGPSAAGSRSATLNIADNAAGSPQTVSLAGSASSAPTPTAFTTYLGTYGSGAQTYHGASVILPVRAYIPGGATQIQYLWANLNAVSGGATEFQNIVACDGAGNCIFRLFDGTNNAPAYPFLSLNSSGSTVTLPTPITLGTMQITAYRLAFAGNEFQLDLSITRPSSFADQIIILASYGQNYSSPWYGVNGSWSNP